MYDACQKNEHNQYGRFRFHLMTLDIRQHSKVHVQAVSELLKIAEVTQNYEELHESEQIEILEQELRDPRPLLPENASISGSTKELLETFRVIREGHAMDQNAVGSYIISMTHHASNFLEVLLLDKETNSQQKKIQVIEGIVGQSMDAYRSLISHEDFWDWYTTITPIQHISKLPIASRTSKKPSIYEIPIPMC